MAGDLGCRPCPVEGPRIARRSRAGALFWPRATCKGRFAEGRFLQPRIAFGASMLTHGLPEGKRHADCTGLCGKASRCRPEAQTDKNILGRVNSVSKPALGCGVEGFAAMGAGGNCERGDPDGSFWSISGLAGEVGTRWHACLTFVGIIFGGENNMYTSPEHAFHCVPACNHWPFCPRFPPHRVPIACQPFRPCPERQPPRGRAHVP
jgi:hypothetical protein